MNTASRMESHGIAGRIQISEDMYRQLRDSHLFEERGEIEIKGKGRLNTWFLLARREQT